jgi:small-conductance mechanosensitive channel
MDSLHRFFEAHLHESFLGNSLQAWVASGCITLAILIFGIALQGLVVARLHRRDNLTARRWQDIVLIAFENTSILFLVVIALHFGAESLELHAKVAKFRDYVFFFVLFYQLGIWLTSALDFFGQSYIKDTVTKEPARATTLSAMIVLGDVAVWVIMVLLFLANCGANISALVAGLGVGGVAVALALQSILGDLFASLAIVLDKPFVIGDAINVSGLSGTVEHIGLKTTRVRSMTGEQLIFSNSDLLKNVVRNYKRMERRRINFNFGLVYETDPAKLHRARELVKAAVEAQKETVFDRCHLATLAASSLDFEVVYWMETSDYNAYINAHHQILVKMLEAFTKEGLEFAYPTQLSLTKPVAHA